MKHLDLTLQDTFEYEGFWWLPDSPDNEIAGTLYYDPEGGIRLSIVGSFEDHPMNSKHRFRCQIINGLTTNGISCTLVDNFQIHQNLNFPGINTQEIRSNLLFLGEIINNVEQIVFNHCRVSLEHLEEWVKPSAFEYEYIEDDGKLIGIDVKVFSRKVFELYVDAFDLTLYLSNTYRTDFGDPKEAILRNEVFLNIRSSTPRDLNSIRVQVTDLSRLIALLIGANTWLRKFQLTLAESVNEKNNGKNILISAFYLPNSTSNYQRLYNHEMLVDFDFILERLPIIFESWLGAGQRLTHVKNLFFAAMYSPNSFLEFKFLSLVHLLESYHRNAFGGTYVKQEIYYGYYNEILNGFPSEIPKDLRKSLQSRLQYGNQFSLRKRLKLLLKDLESELLKLITDSPKLFIKKVVDTRNYYVHFDEDEKGNILDKNEMFYTYQRLGLLVRIVLLREIGFKDKEIFELLITKKRLLAWDYDG